MKEREMVREGERREDSVCMRERERVHEKRGRVREGKRARRESERELL